MVDSSNPDIVPIGIDTEVGRIDDVIIGNTTAGMQCDIQNIAVIDQLVVGQHNPYAAFKRHIVQMHAVDQGVRTIALFAVSREYAKTSYDIIDGFTKGIVNPHVDGFIRMKQVLLGPVRIGQPNRFDYRLSVAPALV